MRHRGTSVLALRLSAGLAAVALPCGVHCESPLPLWLRSLQHASDVRRAGQLTSIVQAAMAYAARQLRLSATRAAILTAAFLADVLTRVGTTAPITAPCDREVTDTVLLSSDLITPGRGGGRGEGQKAGA